jgi:hypothetical protein
MKRLSIIPLAVLAFAPLTRVTAQELPPVKPGDRVRVTAPDLGIRKQAATFEAWRGDTLVIVADSIMNFPLAFVTRLEVGRNRQYADRGAVIGLALGGVVGGVLLGVECANDSFTKHATVGCAVLGAVVFGAGGVLIGALIGAMSTGTRWEEVPLDRLRLQVAPQRDGRFGFGASVRF